VVPGGVVVGGVVPGGVVVGGVVPGGVLGPAAGSEFWQAGAPAIRTAATKFRKRICVFI
jgi:hypothetical protein